MPLLLSILGRMKLPLLAAALLVGAYLAGGNAERKRGEAAHLRVVIETLEKDKAIADAAIASATTKAAALEAADKTQEEELNALRAKLAARPEVDRHGISGADLDEFHWRP